MRFDRLEGYLARLPLKEELRYADAPIASYECVLVKLSSEGVSGWSEVYPGNSPLLTPDWSGATYLTLRDCVAPICATIKGLPAKLLPALHTISAFEKLELKPGSVPEESTVILTCRQDTHPEEDLFTLLSGLHMPILRLAPLQDSLENIFFRVTENL